MSSTQKNVGPLRLQKANSWLWPAGLGFESLPKWTSQIGRPKELQVPSWMKLRTERSQKVAKIYLAGLAKPNFPQTKYALPKASKIYPDSHVYILGLQPINPPPPNHTKGDNLLII